MALLNLFDWERAAAERLNPAAYAYFAGGVTDEITLRENRAAFERLALYPRVLWDVTSIDLTTRVLGAALSMPVLVAPMALARLAHDEGERAIARAVRQAGIVQVLSTASTYSLEEVAELDAPRWFQLYVFRDRGLTEALVRRAEAAGYAALVLTVDVPVPGLRENLVRIGFSPGHLPLRNFLGTRQAAIDENFLSWIAREFDPSLTWRDVEWLRARTRLPLVVKGILRPDDARAAVASGASAIVVSNHGGRQLDGAVATIDALPPIADAVAGACEVLMDGGVRRGTDVVKALARGARAVLVGRPVHWGLAVDGEAGVHAVLELLRGEIRNALALCGAPSIAELPANLVAPRGG